MDNSFDLAALRAQLEPILSSLEAERQQQSQKCGAAAMVCAGLAVVGVLMVLGASGGQANWFLLAPLFVVGIIYSIIASGAQGTYKSGFKTFVMPQLVSVFGNLDYQSDRGLDEAQFNTANLFGRPDRYVSEDLIEGTIGATRLQFSEVHAEERHTRTDSKGRTETSYTTIFRGLFFILDFNKHFSGLTYVLPEGLSGSLGGFGASLQKLGGQMSGRGQLVQLEDPQFEREFVVYSNDQTEARYILSSALMSRLTQLKNRHGGKVAAVFLGGRVYLMIESRENRFEPPALSQPLSFESLQSTIAQLQLATGIVADLDLNTRIWSKE